MLMKCYECGKDVSSLAKACPHCGAPVRDEPVCPKITEAKSQKSKETLLPSPSVCEYKAEVEKGIKAGKYIVKLLLLIFVGLLLLNVAYFISSFIADINGWNSFGLHRTLEGYRIDKGRHTFLFSLAQFYFFLLPEYWAVKNLLGKVTFRIFLTLSYIWMMIASVYAILHILLEAPHASASYTMLPCAVFVSTAVFIMQTKHYFKSTHSGFNGGRSH